MPKLSAVVLALLLLAVPSGSKDKKKEVIPELILRARYVTVVVDPDSGISVANPAENGVARSDSRGSIREVGPLQGHDGNPKTCFPSIAPARTTRWTHLRSGATRLTMGCSIPRCPQSRSFVRLSKTQRRQSHSDGLSPQLRAVLGHDFRRYRQRSSAAHSLRDPSANV